MLAASINYPLRGAVTWKSTVGTNVASDALANLASAGVKGGALIILGEDYGEGASIMQERTHAFAMKSQDVAARSAPASAARSCARCEPASSSPRRATRPSCSCCASAPATSTAASRPKDNRRPAFAAAGGARAPAARLRAHHPAAFDLRAGAREDRAAPAGRAALHRRARHERAARRATRPTSASFCRAGCTTTCCARSSCSAAPIPSARAASRCTYSTSPTRWSRRSGSAILPRQARGARRRGGPARVHRAGGEPDPAQARGRRPHHRQGRAADARRIHGRCAAQGSRRVHRAMGPAAALRHASRRAAGRCAARSAAGAAANGSRRSFRRAPRACAPAVRSARSSPP